MSDDELIEKAKGAFGCLYAHRMMGSIDAIAGLCERYVASRAEVDRLKTLIREVLDADKGTIDPPTVQELEDLLGCLYAHRMMGSIDAIAGLCERYVASRAEVDRLKTLIREVLDADKGTIDPPTVRELEDLLGGQGG